MAGASTKFGSVVRGIIFIIATAKNSLTDETLQMMQEGTSEHDE